MFSIFKKRLFRHDPPQRPGLPAVAPEQLDHVIHAMRLSGALAKLTEQQVNNIVYALQEAGYRVLVKVVRHAPPRDSRKRMEIVIDVVGACNLRCPSCPVGNTGTAVNPAGLLDKELFDKILTKASRDYMIPYVCLYNWAEPLLHPELPALVRLVKGHGLVCALSSNLNILRNEEELLLAKPDAFRISLSGFTQDVYSQMHAKGNIERVKENMRLLSECKKKTGNTATAIHVYFHKYKHNLHEVAPMRRYAESLGFGWQEDWAYYMPIEKVVALAEGTLPKKDAEFADTKFALPIREAVRAAAQYKHEPCRLIAEQLVLDLQGNLILCCGVYDYKQNTLGKFLDMTDADIEAAKKSHSTCAGCAKHGIHRYGEFQGHPQLRAIYDGLAAKNLSNLPAAPRESATARISLPMSSAS